MFPRSAALAYLLPPEIVKQLKILITANYTLAALTGFTNALLISTFFLMKSTDRKRFSNSLLLHQAITDLSISFLTIITSFKTTSPEKFSKLPISIDGIETFTVYITAASLLLTTVERHIALKYSLYHREKLTRFRLVFAALLIWLISFITSLPLNWSTGKIDSSKTMFGRMYYSALRNRIQSVELCIVLVVVVAIVILLVLNYGGIVEHYNELICGAERDHQNQRLHNIQVIRVEERKEIRLFTILIVMVTVYTVTLIPMLVSSISNTVKVNSVEKRFVFISKVVYATSAILNPLLVMFCCDDFRDVIIKCFRRSGQTEPTDSESRADHSGNGEHGGLAAIQKNGGSGIQAENAGNGMAVKRTNGEGSANNETKLVVNAEVNMVATNTATASTSM